MTWHPPTGQHVFPPRHMKSTSSFFKKTCAHAASHTWKNVLSALFHIHKLIDAYDWLVLIDSEWEDAITSTWRAQTVLALWSQHRMTVASLRIKLKASWRLGKSLSVKGGCVAHLCSSLDNRFLDSYAAWGPFNWKIDSRGQPQYKLAS